MQLALAMKLILPCVGLAAALAGAGCYTFQPAAIQSLSVGSPVRAYLSPAGVERMAALTGEAAQRVDATFVRAYADTLVLAVWRTDPRGRQAFRPGRVELALPKQDIASVAMRGISYMKTGALAAGIAGGLYLLFQAVWDDAGGRGRPDSNTGGRF